MASEAAVQTDLAGAWPTTERPAHVPPEMVRDTVAYYQPTTDVDVFSATAAMHETLPRVFFSLDKFGGAMEGSWVVTHYDDIRDVYQNAELYSSRETANFQQMLGETWKMIPISIDPPEHGKYRLLLNPWFSPKAINQMEPRIRATINGLIDTFIDKGECDVAYDFGRLYPVRVFMDLMGFPAEKLEEFLQWEYALLHSYGDVDKMKWGIGSAVAYCRSYIEEVRANPANNLTSHIVHGQVDGRPLTEDEIIGAVAFLWVGGLDTVAATTSLMIRRLCFDQALQSRLRDNPAMIPDAVEEFLRLHPIVNSPRLVTRDHELHGAQLKAGDWVSCFNSAGNFDLAEFTDPREFRLDRPSNRHFTLAGGAHRCLGSHLARRELRIALGEFVRRVPQFDFKPGCDRAASPGLIAMPRLPVVWQVAGA